MDMMSFIDQGRCFAMHILDQNIMIPPLFACIYQVPGILLEDLEGWVQICYKIKRVKVCLVE